MNVVEFAAQACDWELTRRLLSRNGTRVHGRKNINVETAHDPAGTIDCTHSGPFHVPYGGLESPVVAAHDGGNSLG